MPIRSDIEVPDPAFMNRHSGASDRVERQGYINHAGVKKNEAGSRQRTSGRRLGIRYLNISR